MTEEEIAAKKAEEEEQAKKSKGDDSIAKLVQAQVAEQLKEVKAKLDNAYAARDEANRKFAEAEQREKEAKLKQMEEEGKHKEVLETRLAEANAKIEVADRRIVELTRDIEVREALSGLPFRNEKAAKIAYKEVVEGLQQDANGNWKHKSGISIKEYVEAFSKDDEQSFLFKTKTSSGTGSTGANGEPPRNKSGSLFEKSQEEVLKMAREGTLPKRK